MSTLWKYSLYLHHKGLYVLTILCFNLNERRPRPTCDGDGDFGRGGLGFTGVLICRCDLQGVNLSSFQVQGRGNTQLTRVSDGESCADVSCVRSRGEISTLVQP